MTTPLYYEDVQIGDRFESTPTTITQEQMIAFARDFDPQPQHVDPDTARDSIFGTLVASGWHTAAVTMRLQLEAVLGRIPGGAMGAKVDTLVWKKPLLPGATIRATIEVLNRRETRSRSDRGLLTLRTTTYDQTDEPVLEMTAAVFIPKRPVAPV